MRLIGLIGLDVLVFVIPAAIIAIIIGVKKLIHMFFAGASAWARCKFTGHLWEKGACYCARCNKMRPNGHEWEGCQCIICGQTRHKYEDGICVRCATQLHPEPMYVPDSTSTSFSCSTCPYAANSVDNQSFGCYGPDMGGCCR